MPKSIFVIALISILILDAEATSKIKEAKEALKNERGLVLVPVLLRRGPRSIDPTKGRELI